MPYMMPIDYRVIRCASSYWIAAPKSVRLVAVPQQHRDAYAQQFTSHGNGLLRCSIYAPSVCHQCCGLAATAAAAAAAAAAVHPARATAKSVPVLVVYSTLSYQHLQGLLVLHQTLLLVSHVAAQPCQPGSTHRQQKQMSVQQYR
jgi:hypothetical protein